MSKDNCVILRKFVGDQLSRWPLACDNFRALKTVRVREMEVGGLKVKLQFNPARIVSSAAKLDKKDIAGRRCFLCRENRPPEQVMAEFEGRKGRRYHILLNPYPIFPDHLVIAMASHTAQSIWHRYVDMLDLAQKYSGFTFFYNGPKCGASAPDHHHFQGAPCGLMPLENDVDRCIKDVDMGTDEALCAGGDLHCLTSMCDARLYHYKKFTTGIFVLRAATAKSAARLFYRLLDCAGIPEGDDEPRVNLFTYHRDGEFRSIIIFRRQHRSHHYFSDGPDHLTMSPGCADMAGVFIVPVEDEFRKLTPGLLADMISEVSVSAEEEARVIARLTRRQPVIEVGIMSGSEISFEILSDGAGTRKAVYRDGRIEYDGVLYDELNFDARTLSTMFAEPSFVLHDVTIGVGFHWERKEDQKFAGALKIIVADGVLTAINVVGVEDYLLSVISSEMSATSSEEFLKAHAVISRSWVMAQLEAEKTAGQGACFKEIEGGYMKWYDHDDHKLFDVCADDHCQRYQGLTRAVGDVVRKVVDATWGQVLTYDGRLCDARFSKCCGGRMERFSACWGDVDYPYLQPLPDTPEHSEDGRCFCDTDDVGILGQVLNSYDRETVDFFRWTEEYGREELSKLIGDRSGIAVGRIERLVPLERGTSGRIIRLEIVGSEKSVIIGKELEIRRVLSRSHLKSSAFEVEYLKDGVSADCHGDSVVETGGSYIPGWTRIRLHGRGWGHGVGLCQIGAAVMASQGCSYRSILEHYYPGTSVVIKLER